jgi:hypothetical protein
MNATTDPLSDQTVLVHASFFPYATILRNCVGRKRILDIVLVEEVFLSLRKIM